MSKDSTRDYITTAFRLYAALGFPSEKEIFKIGYSGNSIDNRCNIAAAFDLLAVYQTIEHLNRSGKGHICNALKEIYFQAPNREWKKGEINARVVAFAINNYTDERNVWRWLKEARQLCAKYRGLNTASITQLIDDN